MPSTTTSPTRIVHHEQTVRALAIVDQLWDDADTAGNRALADALHDAANHLARIAEAQA